MRKSVRRLWIPVVMLVVGVIMTSIALVPVGLSLTSFITNSYYEESGGEAVNGEVHPIDESITNFSLSLVSADLINIRFTETPGIVFSGSKEGIESLKIINNDKLTKIDSTCNTIINCSSNYYIKTVDVQLPLNYAGKISIDGMASEIIINSEDNKLNLEQIEVNALSSDITITNITSNINLDGADMTFTGNKVDGTLDIDGLNTTTHLYESISPMKIDVDGMNASLTIHDFNPKFGYSLDMDGLDSVFYDNINGSQESSFGTLKRNLNGEDGNFEIRMNGLSQSFTIEN